MERRALRTVKECGPTAPTLKERINERHARHNEDD